jgi:hypothetical protein
MAAYICNAKYVFDVPNQIDTVEIEYTRYIDGIGWKKHKDFINTYPEGDWTELNFDEESSTKYVDFLNTMVYKNIEVARKIAKISLDNVSTKDVHKLIRIMNAIKVLDSTFVPPEININCMWQRELLENIALKTSLVVISTCKNKRRLNRYYRVLQLF